MEVQEAVEERGRMFVFQILGYQKTPDIPPAIGLLGLLDLWPWSFAVLKYQST